MKTEIIELTKLAAPKRSPFGEYLVQQQVLNRLQLFRVLQMQDRVPGARLGACAVALGYAPRTTIETLHERFAYASQGPDLETMTTEAFVREPEVEIVFDIT
ncbi:MAG: hypothetical protein ACM31C_14055 [Acidobacteriota bacterium]